MAGISKQQGPETAAHILVSQETEMDEHIHPCIQITFIFNIICDLSPREWMLPTIKMCLPTSIIIIQTIPQMCSQRFISQLILDPDKLTFNTKHYKYPFMPFKALNDIHKHTHIHTHIHIYQIIYILSS